MKTDEAAAGAVDVARKPTSRTRILIVDDAASTRLFLRGVLESRPRLEVVGEAENGAEAVEMADSLQPDVVLLDLAMPVTDGPSALSGLQCVAPNACVIVLSGRDAREAAPVLAAGATAFIPKGLTPFDLLEQLDAILGRPAGLPRTGPPRERAVDAITAAPGEGQPRSVVCDDDPMTRRLVTKVLANCGVPVLAETDVVPHLLSIVGHAKPDVLVLDLWLEGTTGTSAIPEIRRLSPSTLLVVYSAYEEWRDKALAAGASAFVAKPHFDELEAEIRRLIASSSHIR
jgi:CheY-like chemotaxis protein